MDRSLGIMVLVWHMCQVVVYFKKMCQGVLILGGGYTIWMSVCSNASISTLCLRVDTYGQTVVCFYCSVA